MQLLVDHLYCASKYLLRATEDVLRWDIYENTQVENYVFFIICNHQIMLVFIDMFSFVSTSASNASVLLTLLIENMIVNLFDCIYKVFL